MLHRCNLIQKKTVNRQFVFVPGLFKGVDRGEHYLTMKNSRTGCLIISSKSLFLTECCSTVTKPLYCFQIMKENLFVILLKATGCLSVLHLHLRCLHTHRDVFCSPNSHCVRQIAAGSNRPPLSEAEQCRVWPLFRCSEEEIKAFDEESPRALLGRSPTVTHKCVHVYDYTCVWCVTFVVLVFKFCEIALMPLTNLYVLEFFFFPQVSYISQVVFCLTQSTFSKNLL